MTNIFTSTENCNINDLTYYLRVVTHNKRGFKFKDGVTRIRLEDQNQKLIQWVNRAQADWLEQELPGSIVWR